ncbi:YpmA family protein [Salirhabdus salicampi]|uniref:YpmA family protein n=1 Tax=Salirhabdus salicampi TaxID=476102 RepID=UPI0020C21259|nr:YpmA family protein [Salirhabdus salicampi]MCP8616671.1 YpmA family protein [Salirhabdus salicampi]
MEPKIEVLSTTRVERSEDLYKIVDSLNRTLKDHRVMFGLALDDEDEETAIFTIYKTE